MHPPKFSWRAFSETDMSRLDPVCLMAKYKL